MENKTSSYFQLEKNQKNKSEKENIKILTKEHRLLIPRNKTIASQFLYKTERTVSENCP